MFEKSNHKAPADSRRNGCMMGIMDARDTFYEMTPTDSEIGTPSPRRVQPHARRTLNGYGKPTYVRVNDVFDMIDLTDQFWQGWKVDAKGIDIRKLEDDGKQQGVKSDGFVGVIGNMQRRICEILVTESHSEAAISSENLDIERIDLIIQIGCIDGSVKYKSEKRVVKDCAELHQSWVAKARYGGRG
ncbi:hypothetical protein CPB84DRAFT_1747698 [Gymnopilus junonius]|uniref:Uncharacterized protein n=1 Tax=Gymnopilus junonius TaxID=109634 RepID=A0A9P5NMY9_GYMJU|nr:hypothetical protein CPB84DRAFT_1747698 [Gymnopilus junonius]